MLKFLIDSVEDYYYIYGIVERFVLLFDELSYVENITPTRLAEIKDKAKERLSALISEDDNLSQNTLSKDFNIRILTTKGNVDIYFYSNAFGWNIPDVDLIDTLYSKTEREKSCMLVEVNSVYYSHYNFDYQWMTHLIETIVPSICRTVCGAICSMDK